MAYYGYKITRVIPMVALAMPEFEAEAAKLLTDEEILDLLTEIGANPQAGEVVTGAGGIRKLRFAVSGHGKRGGGRVIYVYYCEELPVFVLTCYPKNRKENLASSDKKELKVLVPALREAYKAGLLTRIKREKNKEHTKATNEHQSDTMGRPQT